MTINHKLRKLLVILQLTTKCPNCQQYFYKPKIVKGLTFCPHCDTNLIQPKTHTVKNLTTSNLQNDIINSASSAFVFAVAIYFHDHSLVKKTLGYFDSFFTLLICIFIVWSLVSIYLQRYKVRTDKGDLSIGKDKLEQVEMDACDGYCHVLEQATTNMYVQPLHCTECESQRITNMFWFKRILAKTNQKIPNYTKESDINEENIYGCLHCHSVFKLENKQMSSAEKKAFIYPVSLMMIALLAFIFNDETVAIFRILTANRLYLSVAVFFVFFCFSLLASTTQKIEHIEPNSKLTKIG